MIQRKQVGLFIFLVAVFVFLAFSAGALTEYNDYRGTAATAEESSTAFCVNSERAGSTITLTQSMGTMHWKTYTDEFVVTGFEKDTSAYADLIVNYRKCGSDHWEITSYAMDFHPFLGDHWIDRDYTITFPETGEYEVRVASKTNQAERKYAEESTADLLAAWLPDHWVGDPPSWHVSDTEGCAYYVFADRPAALGVATEAADVAIEGSADVPVWVQEGTAWWDEEPEWSYMEISDVTPESARIYIFFYRIAGITGTVTFDPDDPNHGYFYGEFEYSEPVLNTWGEIWFTETEVLISMDAHQVMDTVEDRNPFVFIYGGSSSAGVVSVYCYDAFGEYLESYEIIITESQMIYPPEIEWHTAEGFADPVWVEFSAETGLCEPDTISFYYGILSEPIPVDE